MRKYLNIILLGLLVLNGCASTAATAVVFAPAALLISGDGEITEKLANAKGKLRALGIVKNQKGCK